MYGLTVHLSWISVVHFVQRDGGCGTREGGGGWITTGCRTFSGPSFAALGVPLLLVLVGAAARKLVRGTPWIRRDFYPGIDLALAAFSSGLIYLYDIVQVMRHGPTTGVQGPMDYGYALVGGTSFIIVALLVLFLTLTVHQDEERNRARPLRQFILLGVISNCAAGGLLTIFILLVKGVPVP